MNWTSTLVETCIQVFSLNSLEDATSSNVTNLFSLNLKLILLLHLTPERLLLQCPDLESVHASDCEDMLVKTIETQVLWSMFSK